MRRAGRACGPGCAAAVGARRGGGIDAEWELEVQRQRDHDEDREHTAEEDADAEQALADAGAPTGAAVGAAMARIGCLRVVLAHATRRLPGAPQRSRAGGAL